MIHRISVIIVAIVLVVSFSSIVAAQEKAQKEGMKEKSAEMTKADKEMKMGPLKSFACDASCGFMARSRDVKELTAMATKHMKAHHNMSPSEKEVRGMLKTEAEPSEVKKQE